MRLFGNSITLVPNAPPLDAVAIGKQVGSLAEPAVDLELDGLVGTHLFRGLALTVDWIARTATTRLDQPAAAELVGGGCADGHAGKAEFGHHPSVVGDQHHLAPHAGPQPRMTGSSGSW